MQSRCLLKCCDKTVQCNQKLLVCEHWLEMCHVKCSNHQLNQKASNKVYESSQWRPQKSLQGQCLINLQWTFLIFPFFWFSELVMSSKVCKPDNFELLDSLNLRFTNIQRLCSNFVGYESFLESNSSDILAGY